MENIISGVYKIRNIVNNKIYVGSAINLKSRKSGHFSKLKSNKHQNPHLQNTYNKYGKENFIFEVIEYVEHDKKILLEREDYWINLLKANQREFGYNIRKKASNNLGLPCTEIAKQKISLSLVGKYTGEQHADFSGDKNPFYGKRHSLESKKKQSENHPDMSGKRNAMFGKFGENHPNFNCFRTEEFCKQSSLFRVGKKTKINSSSKYVGIYKRLNGTFSAKICHMGEKYYLGTFLTEQEAAIAYNLKARELYGIDYDINTI